MKEIARSTVTLRDLRNLADDVQSVTIFANELSRDGVTVDPEGMDFSAYEKNPVVLYAHDFAGRTDSGGLPIGRTRKLVRTARGHIRAEFEFLSGDPFADRVRNAWNQGFLRGASIGWRAIESSPTSRGVRVVRSELLEWSIVAVPADPDALRESYRRMISALLDDDHAPGAPGDHVIFDHVEDSAGGGEEPLVADDAPGAERTTPEEPDFSETRGLLAELRETLTAATKMARDSPHR